MQQPSFAGCVVDADQRQGGDQAKAGTHQCDEAELALAVVGRLRYSRTSEEWNEIDALHRDADQPHGGGVAQLMQENDERNEESLLPAKKVPEACEREERQDEPVIGEPGQSVLATGLFFALLFNAGHLLAHPHWAHDALAERSKRHLGTKAERRSVGPLLDMGGNIVVRAFRRWDG